MNNVLEVADLTVEYNGKAIIENASLQIDEGSLTYLFGSNGAGKTTLIRAILGLETYSRGKIKVFNKPNTQEQISKYISYLPQYPHIDRNFPISVGEMIGLACSTHPDCPLSVDEHLEHFNALDIKYKKLSQLSGGQMQKALIARALIGNKPILILDEPFNHLDHKSEAFLISMLKQMYQDKSRTVLIVTHDQSMVDENSDCLMLVHGHLHYGKATQVLTEHKLGII